MVIQSTKSLNATRSATDCKDYELVTLSNGLRTLLVSSKALLAQHQQKSGKDGSSKEEGSIKAAAALAVQVGSFFDPPDAEGTAHYLEVSHRYRLSVTIITHFLSIIAHVIYGVC